MFEDTCYTRNYLHQVIARVDFVSPLRGIETKLAPAVSKQILTSFPIAEPRTAIAHHLQISSDAGVAPSTVQRPLQQWLFHGKRREKTFTIEPTTANLVYTSYRSFEELESEFLGIVSILIAEYKDAQPVRLGLRYINSILLDEARPLEWSQWINKDMLALLAFVPDEDKPMISRAFNILELNFDSFNLTYQFGMPNSDHPAPIRQKNFVLDLDAYYQGVFDAADLRSKLKEFHDGIQKYFELSITNKLREKMNA